MCGTAPLLILMWLASTKRTSTLRGDKINEFELRKHPCQIGVHLPKWNRVIVSAVFVCAFRIRFLIRMLWNGRQAKLSAGQLTHCLFHSIVYHMRLLRTNIDVSCGTFGRYVRIFPELTENLFGILIGNVHVRSFAINYSISVRRTELIELTPPVHYVATWLLISHLWRNNHKNSTSHYCYEWAAAPFRKGEVLNSLVLRPMKYANGLFFWKIECRRHTTLEWIRAYFPANHFGVFATILKLWKQQLVQALSSAGAACIPHQLVRRR